MADELIQVGAVLHFNSGRELDPRPTGGRHWVLDGSCTLASPARTLGISHTLDKSRRAAVFLPGQGFFLVQGVVPEPQKPGDNVVLMQLSRESAVPPLPWLRTSREQIDEVMLHGFGRWTVHGRHLADGIQRAFKVNPRGIERPDNLDISWTSAANGGMTTGVNTSGGPLIFDNHLVAMHREENNGRHDASRVTDDRRDWLVENKVPSDVAEPAPTHEWRLIDASTPELRPLVFGAPEGARRVGVTLCATPGLRLQMRIFASQPTPQDLDALRQHRLDSGRFLYRELGLPPNSSQIWVGVVSVQGDPAGAPGSEAQLCVLWSQ
jgi:hypothetical protein